MPLGQLSHYPPSIGHSWCHVPTQLALSNSDSYPDSINLIPNWTLGLAAYVLVLTFPINSNLYLLMRDGFLRNCFAFSLAMIIFSEAAGLNIK